ncbi:serine hydrolase domain-containing protein [Alkalicoccus urumqiensis]|uniref:Serine hydrolase n=1 Tax=Alkalicoccus urumqiensis TaxID=1548213 RepID=A0A2P6MKZ9_ALKUR|nr:serine hydrolase [Alkalicoccus urumqiensis]PRO66944.1 serine hydrolase [Alkalicoccus urumqiensis]
MYNKLIGALLIIITGLVGLFMYTYYSIEAGEESSWPRHSSLEDAGFNPQALDQARAYYESLNSTAAMVIYRGRVLFEWGDVSKSTNAHSVRKSLLSALYGIELEQGTMHLNQTLVEFGIDDQPPLTTIERQAELRHLMTSSSGVYLPAGEESIGMRVARPGRGSFLPGENYYYNNWDFNVLGTIYNEQTESDLFEDFFEKIAQPIGMEDLDPADMNYKYENRRSRHPSYLFQMSARDMARFGQLYLQEGRWDGRQIVPEWWVEESTKPQKDVPSNNVMDYGYLWWTASDGPFADLDMYSAVGRYGQSIDIIPELDLVFVHRVDSNRLAFQLTRSSVNELQRLQLLQLILDARQSQ